MALAVRYRSEFYSDNGVFWRVDIMDNGSFSGGMREFSCAPPFFSVNYAGSKQRFDPIIHILNKQCQTAN